MPRKDAPLSLRRRVERYASSMLLDMVGPDKAKEAAARVAMAFAAAHRSAKNPQDLERCTPESIAAAVAHSALADLMPGGAMPSCWLIPRGRELQWMISHRGLMTLSRRAGYQLSAVPVGMSDHVAVEYGEVTEHRAELGSEPQQLSELRGVIVVCKQIADGFVLGRYWVPGSYLQKCSRLRGAGPVWKAWPIEMAQKTAIKWACARGYVPIQSIEMATALAADAQTHDAAQPVEVERPQMQLASEVFAPAPEVEAEIIEDATAIGGAE